MLFDIGEYLRERREIAGLTQSDVSKYLGYKHPQMISNVERGFCAPPINALGKWCKKIRADKGRVIEMMVDLYRQDLMAGGGH